MSEKTCQDKCILCCERCAKSFSARFLKATYAKRRGLTYVLIALAVLGVITTFEGMRGSERDWTKYCSYAAFLLHAGAGVSAARGMQSLTPMPWMFFSTFAGFAAVLDILVYAFAVRIASVIALTLLLYAKLFCVSWTVFFGMQLKDQDTGLGGLLDEDPIEIVAKRLLVSVSWSVPGMGFVNHAILKGQLGKGI